MTDQHSHTNHYYECALCDDTPEFVTQDLCQVHVDSRHKAAIIDTPAFLQLCRKPKIIPKSGCPLCSVASIEDDVSGEKLLTHVAAHVHSFSLSSLPICNEDDETTREYFRANPYFDDSQANSSTASYGSRDQDVGTDDASSATHDLEEPSSIRGPSVSSEASGRHLELGGGDKLTASSLKLVPNTRQSDKQSQDDKMTRISLWTFDNYADKTGFQARDIYGPVNTTFHLPPGELRNRPSSRGPEPALTDPASRTTGDSTTPIDRDPVWARQRICRARDDTWRHREKMRRARLVDSARRSWGRRVSKVQPH